MGRREGMGNASLSRAPTALTAHQISNIIFPWPSSTMSTDPEPVDLAQSSQGRASGKPWKAPKSATVYATITEYHDIYLILVLADLIFLMGLKQNPGGTGWKKQKELKQSKNYSKNSKMKSKLSYRSKPFQILSRFTSSFNI